ncbi:MAG: hydroxypyruvate isomerase, partial [Segetibacter sp.]|nr:hydroxypyruvate isomerase [Segetibacter sp.]
MAKKTSRRTVFKNLVLGGTAVIAAPALAATGNQNIKKSMLKGNINHSVCRWTYSSVPLEELCQHVNQIGFAA